MVSLKRQAFFSRKPRRSLLVICCSALSLASIGLIGSRSTSEDQSSTDTAAIAMKDHAQPSVVAFSKNGNLLAVGIGRFLNPAELQIVSPSTGRRLAIVKFSFPHVVASGIAISPNQRFVAASALSMGGSSEWFVFDRWARRVSKLFPRRCEPAFGFAFNNDGSLMATVGADKDRFVVCIRNVADGKTVARFKLTHQEHVPISLVFSPNGNYLAFADRIPGLEGTETGTVVVWDWKRNRAVHSITGFRHSVSLLAFSPNGEWFVTAGGPMWSPSKRTGESEIVVWRRDGTRLAELMGPRGDVTALSVSLDGRQIAASSFELCGPPTIHTWRTVDWKPGKTLTAKKALAVRSLHFADNGMLTAASADGTVRHWDIRRAVMTGQTIFWKDERPATMIRP